MLFTRLPWTVSATTSYTPPLAKTSLPPSTATSGPTSARSWCSSRNRPAGPPASCLPSRTCCRPIAGRPGRDRTTSFAELDRAGARAAALLWRHGLRPGDAVLVLHPMSAELYVALLAIFRLGLRAMFLDPATGMDHVTRSCALQPP